MRVLFDNGTPRGLAVALPGHTVEEARSRGWDALGNGELLDAAEAAGFEVFLTTDRSIRYQQNLTGRKLAIVVLDKARWRLIKTRLTEIAAAGAQAKKIESARRARYTATVAGVSDAQVRAKAAHANHRAATPDCARCVPGCRVGSGAGHLHVCR